MNGRVNSEYGGIEISSDVIAIIAGSAAVGCFGVIGMAAYSMKDGLVHLLKKDSLQRGINVKITNNKIELVLHCIVSYGVSIPAITDNLIEIVQYKVEQFTGMEIEHIDILIEGIRVID
ncbi:MAG: Asp23/Gls24 family envelope stress response protein [Lachnospiraceae bacterium]|nr:Asp23/Gls24 family envelope stress response protein [Lachnospiraceae bacterium]